jgi:hypothetical protein
VEDKPSVNSPLPFSPPYLKKKKGKTEKKEKYRVMTQRIGIIQKICPKH